MEKQNSTNQPEEKISEGQVSEEQLEQISGGDAVAQPLQDLLDDDPTNPGADDNEKSLFLKKNFFFFHRRHGRHGHHGHHH